MNILVLTPLVPYPPHDGDKLRLYHFLRELKRQGHVIDLVCLTRVREDFSHGPELEKICGEVILEHLTDRELFFNLIGGMMMGLSLNVSSYFSPRLRERIRVYWAGPRGQKVDVVLAHRLRMAPAAFEGNPGKPIVLELTDCLTAYTGLLKGQKDARFSRRWSAWWDHWFLKSEEAEWTSKAFKSVVISPADAQALWECGAPFSKVEVIPNGISLDRKAGNKRPSIYPADRPVVCFVGNMGYTANEDGALWFLKKIWPLIKHEVPDAVFAAVGGQPREKLRHYHNGDDIWVTGWVPEVESYVKYAKVTVAPLRVAAGMQNKVALSLGLGVPVVATSSAVGWLPPEGRKWVLQTQEEEDFARKVAETLLRPRKAKALAMKGRGFILKNYRWNSSGKALGKVLREAARTKDS